MALADDDFVVLFAGKFIEVKRPMDLIGARRELATDVVLAMAGNGPVMAETREAADRLGVSGPRGAVSSTRARCRARWSPPIAWPFRARVKRGGSSSTRRSPPERRVSCLTVWDALPISFATTSQAPFTPLAMSGASPAR